VHLRTGCYSETGAVAPAAQGGCAPSAMPLGGVLLLLVLSTVLSYCCGDQLSMSIQLQREGRCRKILLQLSRRTATS
jgi:hypothetical protein